MYNAHRGMVPAPNSRLAELLDQVRAEFDSQQNRTGEYEQQSEFVRFLCACLSSCHACSRIFVEPALVLIDNRQLPNSHAKGCLSCRSHEDGSRFLPPTDTSQNVSGRTNSGDGNG